MPSRNSQCKKSIQTFVSASIFDRDSSVFKAKFFCGIRMIGDWHLKIDKYTFAKMREFNRI